MQKKIYVALLSARPTVAFPASQRHPLPLGRYQFILLGEQKQMSVKGLPRVAA